MRHNLSWKMLQNILDYSRRKGEEIVSAMKFESPPVDPFKIIEAEPDIYAEGADLKDAFDGCLRYVGPRFLLAFNTKYDHWYHRGKHHPKVRFTIGHELGHYYLKEHRNYLLRGGKPHECFTEFQSLPYVDRQADCFAAGLLMPSKLVSPCVNLECEPTFEVIKRTAHQFDVSLTSMLVRWTQLSHFPCSTMSVSPHGIDWGWVSEGFKRAKIYKVRRNEKLISEDARKFMLKDPKLLRYAEGQGLGLAHHWLKCERLDISIREFYAVIPYIQRMLVFIVADEEEVYREEFADGE